MSKLSCEGIGEMVVTLPAADGVAGGQVVTLGEDGQVAACASGQRPCGVALEPRGGCAAVQVGGFARVELQPGESRTVRFEVGPRQLRTLGADYVWRVEPGRFEIQLGDNAENILLTAPLTVAQG